MSNKFSTTDIVAQFPIALADMPKIATATTRPSYTSITKFQEAINSQALAIPINNSDLGHLALVITRAEYASVNNNVAFVAPTSPGEVPVHTGNPTAAQIAETNRIFQVNTNTFQVFQNTRTQLRSMIINATPDQYICALKHSITQYANVTPLQLMNHLKATYGAITSDDLTSNYERMTAPWNPPTPIETLFNQLKEGKEFAQKGHERFENSQLMRLAYDNIKATGLFDVQCREWRHKSAAEKNYTNFVEFFTAAETDRNQNEATTGSAGYSANAVREAVRDEFNTIMAEQATDTSTANLTHDDVASFLGETQPTEQANAAVTMENLESLLTKLMDSRNNDNRGSRYRNRDRDRDRDRNRDQPVAQGFDDDGKPISYCWSHGITHNLKHHSCSCKRKKEGHKDAATLHNRLGGSNEICKPTRGQWNRDRNNQ